jgi:hypothetical protein
MNQDHHEQLALDAVRSLIALGPQKLPSLPAAQAERIVGAIGKGGNGPDATRWQYKQAASLPDRIRDTELELPDFFHDKYCVAGHNLSSSQHFECSNNGTARGYLWKEDRSLSLIGDVISENLLSLFHTRVIYLPDRTGEAPPSYADGRPTPMAQSFAEQPNTTLGDFVFPAASLVGDFYAGLARDAWGKQNTALWRRAAGFALHFVQDALVPHHCWGALLFGHSDWEDTIDTFWTGQLREMLIAGNSDRIYGDTVAKAVGKELAAADLSAAKSVADVVKANAAFTLAWLAAEGSGQPQDLADCSMIDGLRVCTRAVASSVRALLLMSA